MHCSMVRRVLILLLGAGAGLYPLFSFALGLGDLQVESRLNQPLRARIEVSDVSDNEWRVLRARLSPEISQGDGLLRQVLLDSMTFKTIEDENHRRFIEVKSTDAFTEPLFDISIDVTGASLNFTRSYTVFLDPPGPNDDLPGARGPALVSQPGVAAQGRHGAVASSSADSTAQSGSTVRREPDLVVHRRRQSAPAASVAAPAAKVAEDAAIARAVTASYTVTKADTLEKIARRFGGATAANRNQFMDWVFQHNPTAFYGDMNHLRADVRLALPESAAAAAPVSTAQPPAAGGPAAKAQLQGELTDLQQELTGLQKMIAQQNVQIASLKQQVATRGAQRPAPADRSSNEDSDDAVTEPQRAQAMHSGARASDDRPDANKSTTALAHADQGGATATEDQTASDHATVAQSPSASESPGAAESTLDQAQSNVRPSIWARYHIKPSVYFEIAGIVVLVALIAYLVAFIRRRIEEANPRVHLRYEIGPTYQKPPEPVEPRPPLTQTMPMIRPSGSGSAAARLHAALKRLEPEDAADTHSDLEEIPAEPQSGLDTWRTQTALLEQDMLSETDVLPFVLDTRNQLKTLDEELLAPAELTAESRDIVSRSATENRPDMFNIAPTERLPRVVAGEIAEHPEASSDTVVENTGDLPAERSATNKEIVQALESSLDYQPDRVDIQLKLLEIYHHEALDNRENFHTMLHKLSDLKNLSPAQRVHVEMLQRTLHDGDATFATEEEI
jgi:Tfp pilus assembly protein FimV